MKNRNQIERTRRDSRKLPID